jgi:hypothetical protein
MRRLEFALATPHPDEEEQFLQALMTPGSPQFHKFLTADQWIARFAPAAADEQAVVDWATSQGLTVTHRFSNRLIVNMEGPMATIEKALQVKINNYQMDGYTYFANEHEPVLPAGVAGMIRNVEGLHNFPLMRPASSHGPIPPGAIYNPGPAVGPPLTHHADGDRGKYEQARAASHANAVHPRITNKAYDPTDIYAPNAYDYDALQNQGHCCNPNGLSTGAPPQSSIAIAAYGNLHFTGSYPNAVFTDIAAFAGNGSPAAVYPYLAFNVTGITVDGGPGFCTVTTTNPCGADLETTLDTEWTLSTANSFGSYLDTAQIFVYQGEGGYPGGVLNQILSDGNAKVFTTSFGCGGEDQCGGTATSGLIGSMHSIFNSMAGQGWTMMSFSGDQGATGDCTTTTGTTSVEYPGSDPDIVGVGGTALQSGGLGGIFGGEVAWTGGTTKGSCAFPTNNGGSTGGCSAVFPVPGYQAGSNASCGTQRSVPDIALNAAINQNMYFNGALFGVGGTSIASPMMAGFFAQEGAYLVYLTNVTGNDCGSFHVPCEPVDGGMGNGNYYLYQFGQNPFYAPHYPFYDITSGCNSNDITALLSLTFYCAGTGYDSVTGWGTANMLQLGWAINSYIAGDFSPPAVNFSGEIPGHWYNVPPTVFWSVSGTPGSGAVSNGVAGFSQAWDADPGDVYLGSRASYNNSYFSGPEYPNATFGLYILTMEGCHTANVRAWDNGGTSSNNTFLACLDSIPPTVNCVPPAPDGLWHANNPTFSCTAKDNAGGSGLANPADASFNLTTSVPAGTETASAFTPSRVVLDVAGNSTTAGPIGPNMVDRKPPSVNCGSPDGKWHATDVSIPCTASDLGSGLAVPADASFNLTTSVPVGTETNNASTNAHAVLDKVGNTTTAGPISGNMVDKKPPTIAIAQPTATNYTHSSTLTLSYTVTDGGSGVNSVTPTMNGSTTVGGSAIVNGLAINLLTALPLGPNTFLIKATDNVGNASSLSVTFTIIVTAASIIADVNELQASGAITMNTNPLLAKLNNALADITGGNCNAAENVYGAFINQVMAQTGKGITAAAAAILIADAQYLEANCP